MSASSTAPMAHRAATTVTRRPRLSRPSATSDDVPARPTRRAGAATSSCSTSARRRGPQLQPPSRRCLASAARSQCARANQEFVVVHRGLQTRVEVAHGHGGCLDVNGVTSRWFAVDTLARCCAGVRAMRLSGDVTNPPTKYGRPQAARGSRRALETTISSSSWSSSAAPASLRTFLRRRRR